MIDRRFLAEFKRETEAKWAIQSTDPKISGFQFQRGTRWLPGLSDEQIAEYEAMVGSQFPYDLRTFLQEMNGTDLPTVNVNASSGEPQRQSVGVYSYPRDVELLKDRMAMVQAHRTVIARDLADQGFDLGENPNLIPIYSHRYVVATQDLSSSVVLSIVVNDVDAIVYGNSLQMYLAREFLGT
jgi:hypothetical protein